MLILPETDISAILRNLNAEHAERLRDTLSSGLVSYTEQITHGTGKPLIHQPHRTGIVTNDGDTTLVMPVSDSSNTGVKVVMVPKQGDIKGAITIYNSVGELDGVLNAAEITAFRTALASMVALTLCKTMTTEEMVIFGAGKQTEWHARLALRLLSGVKRITIVNRSQGRLQELEKGLLQDLRGSYSDVVFETLGKENNQQYEQVLREKLRNADVICCCTPSRVPLFGADDLKNDAKKARFISLIGSYKPEMQEIDTETLRSADRVWVDSKKACLEESGELIRAGMRDDELAEIGELLKQRSDAQAVPKLTIFKCVGLGIMDLVIGKALLEIGGELGKGIKVEGF